LLWMRVQGGVIKALQGTTLGHLVEFSEAHARDAERESPATLTACPLRRTMADLEIRNLHVRAGEKEILKGLDLKVETGKIHALMGPNGSGKSMLAHVIMGHPNMEV